MDIETLRIELAARLELGPEGIWRARRLARGAHCTGNFSLQPVHDVIAETSKDGQWLVSRWTGARHRIRRFDYS